MLTTIFILMALVAAEPHVVATLKGPEFTRMGIVADLVERPAGITDEQFAQQLIDAEGLRPWDGEQLNFPEQDGGMGTMAVFSADGREMIVKYVSSDLEHTGQVCRLRLARGGASSARWNAYRWCASAFGLSLPERRAPPVASVRQQR
jgi:hypothetical protein